MYEQVQVKVCIVPWRQMAETALRHLQTGSQLSVFFSKLIHLFLQIDLFGLVLQVASRRMLTNPIVELLRSGEYAALTCSTQNSVHWELHGHLPPLNSTYTLAKI